MHGSGRREPEAAPPEGGQAHLALGDGRGLGDRSQQRNRRGLSIARYLVELVERDASEEDAGLRHECPELTLAAEEQRELLEAVREVRALMLEGEDAGPLVRDMQERIAVMFAAWASALVASGRSEELCAALASVVGEERARIAAASVVASVAPSAAKRAKVPQAGEGKTDPRQDRPL